MKTKINIVSEPDFIVTINDKDEIIIDDWGELKVEGIFKNTEVHEWLAKVLDRAFESGKSMERRNIENRFNALISGEVK